jgi:hypothetical protein
MVSYAALKSMNRIYFFCIFSAMRLWQATFNFFLRNDLPVKLSLNISGVEAIYWACYTTFDTRYVNTLLFIWDLNYTQITERFEKIGRGFIKIFETWQFGLSFNSIRHIFFCFGQKSFVSDLWIFEKFWYCAKKNHVIK